MYKLICILFFIIYSHYTYSQELYVSVEGNNLNRGTVEQPFKTIQHALKEALLYDGHVTIYLREGIYPQQETLLLQNTSNITITAYPNESVSITGGVELKRKHIHKIKDKSILNRFSKDVQKKVRYIDFNTLGIQISNLDKRGFVTKTMPSWNEVFINEKPLYIAQWPNKDEEMIMLHKVINSGDNPSKGIKGKGKPIIGYRETEPDTWSSVKNGWIYGYFKYGWAEECLPLAYLDTVNNAITINGTSYYGIEQNGHYTKWCIRNLPEILDKERECIIDYETNIMYFLPAKKNIKRLQVSILKEPIFSIQSCKDITIKNIKIECSRGRGVDILNSEDVIIDSCILRNLGNIAVKINKGTSNSGVKNSYIYQTGAGGIELDGGNRYTLESGNNFVKNCRIHDFNRIEITKRPGINLYGCGNVISNVEIFNAPNMAIYLHGNNHTIEYTDIHHVCQESHDVGAIYYGRDPTERGNKIRYSYIHDIQSYSSITVAIYHDDGACGMDVYGCIFSNISSAPILIGGGQDITYTNNIFMNLPYVIQIDNRLQIWQSYAKWLQPNGEYDKNFKAVNYTHPPYSEAYPQLLEYWINNPEIPKRNVIKNNIFYNIDKLIKGDNKFLIWEKNYECTSNPGFINTTSPLQGFNAENLKRQNPFFIPIPTKNIGCKLLKIE